MLGTCLGAARVVSLTDAECAYLQAWVVANCKMKLMLLLLLHFAVSISAVTLPPQDADNGVMWCDKDFTLHNNFCYRYYGAEMRKPYHYAQKLCLRSQSSLLSLHNAQEESFVAALAGDHAEFWISLNDEDGPADAHREGYFKWGYGGWEEVEFNVENDSYCHWKPGQPKNKQHLDCVKVDMEGWTMAPGGCAASKLPVICKKKACPVGKEWVGSTCEFVTGEVERSLDGQYQVFMLLALLIVLLLLGVIQLLTWTRWFGISHHQQLRTKTLQPDLFPT